MMVGTGSRLGLVEARNAMFWGWLVLFMRLGNRCRRVRELDMHNAVTDKVMVGLMDDG